MKNSPLLEACVETLAQAVAAEKNGAGRIELCADLSVGGLTPNIRLINKVLEKTNIPVMAMLRPRPGNFIYTKSELIEMENTIHIYKKIKVHGLVLGLLTDNNQIDIHNLQRLSAVAKSPVGGRPMPVTFHKAIDRLNDPVAGVLELIKNKIPIDRVLTSGGADTAIKGAAVIKKMIAETIKTNNIKILPAGKITFANLPEIHKKIGAQEYHGRRIVAGLN